MGRAFRTYGGGAYRVLVEKPERKRPLGRNRRRWEDNIKMNLLVVGWGTDWILQAQVVVSCECGNEPQRVP
jgi:hypothetical protein